MKHRSRKCSSCKKWIKLAWVGPVTGMCEYHDIRCGPSYSCLKWKGTKIPTRER